MKNQTQDKNGVKGLCANVDCNVVHGLREQWTFMFLCDDRQS